MQDVCISRIFAAIWLSEVIQDYAHDNMQLSALTEKFSSLGAIISAMGCASCFPALGAIGASLGLGFLAEFEELFIISLLPIFASIALAAGLFSWYSYRNHLRGLLAVTGPSMVLVALYLFPFWEYGWSTYMFYGALLLMLAVAIWDIVSPPRASCRVSLRT